MHRCVRPHLSTALAETPFGRLEVKWSQRESERVREREGQRESVDENVSKFSSVL